MMDYSIYFIFKFIFAFVSITVSLLPRIVKVPLTEKAEAIC